MPCASRWALVPVLMPCASRLFDAVCIALGIGPSFDAVGISFV